MNETDLLHTFIERTPHALPHVRVFRRAIINERSARGHWLKNGIKGQADAYAIVQGGRHVELETKAARGVMADAQRAWRSFCAGFGIAHLVLRARADEAPEDTVARWIEELGEAVNGHE